MKALLIILFTFTVIAGYSQRTEEKDVFAASSVEQDTIRFKVITGAGTIYFDSKEEFDTWMAQNFPTSDLAEFILEEKREQIGKEAMKNLIKAIRTLITDGAQRVSIAKTLTPVFMLLGDGFIQDAYDLCNAETVTATFTQGRKNFVLGEIQKALDAVNE